MTLSPPRGLSKKEKEKGTIEDFLEYYNRCLSTKYQLIEQPDPPDGIITYGHLTTWIEITEVHYDQIDVEFHNVPFGRTHKFKEKEWKSGSVMRSAGVIEEPDKKIVQAFLDSIQRKDATDSYEEFERRYGKGMLLLDRPTDPLIDSGTIEMLDRWKKELPKFWTSKFFSGLFKVRNSRKRI